MLSNQMVATFTYERWNSLNTGMRTSVIFFALFPSRATRALCSPRFHLCQPKIRKKLCLFCRLYFQSKGRRVKNLQRVRYLGAL